MQARVLKNATLPLIAATAFSALSFSPKGFAAEGKSGTTTSRTSTANDLYDKIDALAPLKRELNEKLKPDIVLGAIRCSFEEGGDIYFINTNNQDKPLLMWDDANKSFVDDLKLVESAIHIDPEDKKLGSFAFDLHLQFGDEKALVLTIARHHKLNLQIFATSSDPKDDTKSSSTIDMFQLTETKAGKFVPIKSEDKINGVKIIGGASSLPKGVYITVPEFLTHRESQADTALIIKTQKSSILLSDKYAAIEIKPKYQDFDDDRDSPDIQIRLYTAVPKSENDAPETTLYLKDGQLVPGYKSLGDSLRDMLKEHERSKGKKK